MSLTYDPTMSDRHWATNGVKSLVGKSAAPVMDTPNSERFYTRPELRNDEGVQSENRVFLCRVLETFDADAEYERDRQEREFGKTTILQQLGELSRLPSDWNGYSAEPPNARSIALAESFALALVENEIMPDKLVASVDGGVGIYMTREHRYAVIECSNDGEVAAVASDGCGDIRSWSLDLPDEGFKEPLDDIRAFLRI